MLTPIKPVPIDSTTNPPNKRNAKAPAALCPRTRRKNDKLPEVDQARRQLIRSRSLPDSPPPHPRNAPRQHAHVEKPQKHSFEVEMLPKISRSTAKKCSSMKRVIEQFADQFRNDSHTPTSP
jgi:hypothetical protein